MITKVVGVTFKNEKYNVDRQSIIRKLRGDEEVILRREPKNRFDPNAVGVFVRVDGKILQVGYLKAELAGIVADLWKQYRFNSSIEQIRLGNDVNNVPWGMTLKITKEKIQSTKRKKAHKGNKRKRKHANISV